MYDKVHKTPIDNHFISIKKIQNYGKIFEFTYKLKYFRYFIICEITHSIVFIVARFYGAKFARNKMLQHILPS